MALKTLLSFLVNLLFQKTLWPECIRNNFIIWSLRLVSVGVSRNVQILIIIAEVFVIGSPCVLVFAFYFLYKYIEDLLMWEILMLWSLYLTFLFNPQNFKYIECGFFFFPFHYFPSGITNIFAAGK